MIVKIFDQTQPYVSGYSMRSRYITDSLTTHGLRLRVFRSPVYSYERDRETIDGVEYITTPFVSSRTPGRELKVINSLYRKVVDLWDDDIKAVHAHSSVLNGMAGLRAARKKKVPFIYEVRALWEDAAVDQGKTREGSPRYYLTRQLETYVLRRADHITAICQGLKKDICDRGISSDKVTIIPNGVDTNQFQPVSYNTELAKRLGLEGRFVIGFIGTFFLFEGIELIIEAAKRITAQRPDVKFLIVGGGRQENELKATAQRLGLGERVIFTGRVKHAEIKDYYSIIDLMVYPRTSKRITELVTPLKPLEAMALRRPVLGSDVGGIKELVEDGQTGLLFRKGSVDHLVERCLYAMDHPQQLEEIKERARHHVEQNRNWFNICRRYLEVYRKLGMKI